MSSTGISAFPPFFGERRQLSCGSLEPIEIDAADHTRLMLHHVSGGKRGPVVLAPGTAMTALSYCIDTLQMNLVEYLVSEGFDVWLFDWRTSPLLEAHKRPYTLDDVARYDWPAAIAEVRARTGAGQVSVLAHCLSSPTFLLSLVRGHVDPTSIRVFVASQVALHLRFTGPGTMKVKLHLDSLIPPHELVHQRPQDVGRGISDLAASFLTLVMPRSFDCDNRACYRHVATFGELILHSRINRDTHELMGDLVPECLTGVLKHVAVWARRDTILTEIDRQHLDRLRLPIHFISGSENRMFIPESTEDSFKLLCEVNGPDYYRRKVYAGFGHLDCYFGVGAAETIWPDLSAAFDCAVSPSLPIDGPSPAAAIV